MSTTYRIAWIPYAILQWTWGLPQNIVGLVVLLANLGRPHGFYKGCIVTTWQGRDCASLGMFVFMTERLGTHARVKNRMTHDELWQRYLVHEYGHTIQSLIFGPLYLLVMALPSMLWCYLPTCRRQRRKGHRTYSDFFTERFANFLGTRTVRQPALQGLPF